MALTTMAWKQHRCTMGGSVKGTVTDYTLWIGCDILSLSLGIRWSSSYRAVPWTWSQNWTQLHLGIAYFIRLITRNEKNSSITLLLVPVTLLTDNCSPPTKTGMQELNQEPWHPVHTAPSPKEAVDDKQNRTPYGSQGNIPLLVHGHPVVA